MTETGSAWQPREYVPLREQVHEELRARVIDGRLQPGDRIVETAVASELGVSRVPVREAIRMLEADGLVEVVPRKGLLVRELTRQDVDEIFQMREALEVLACRLATEKATPADIARLTKCVDEGRKVLARDISKATEASAEFHDMIARISGNRLLTSTLETLNGRVRWVLQHNNDPVLMFEEHERILQTIKAGDAEGAARLAKQHVARSRRTTIQLTFGDDAEADPSTSSVS